MRARRRRREHTRSEDEPGAEERGSPLAALQESAGNRAVSRLIQRQDAGGPAISPVAPRVPNLRLGADSPLVTGPPPLSQEASRKVRAFLEERRYEIASRVLEGTISMPEVVRMVREGVPEAASAAVPDLENEVRAAFGPTPPPPERRKRTAEGTGSELAARIANALPSLPKLRVDLSRGSIELTLSGLVATTRVRGATVTATGTPGGGEVTAEKGSTSVTVSGGTDEFGLKTRVDRVAFEAKIQKDRASGEWSKWEAGLRVSLVGDEPLEQMTDIPELREAVATAEAAIRRIIEHLAAGGKPTDPEVRELMKDVKPAFEGVKRAVEAPKGPRVTVGAGVKGGDERLGVVGGLSLIVEF